MVLTALQFVIVVALITVVAMLVLNRRDRRKEGRINASFLSDVIWVIMEIIRCARRLPRVVVELLLPPHKICPMVFWHLSLKEWRENAEDYCQNCGKCL